MDWNGIKHAANPLMHVSKANSTVIHRIQFGRITNENNNNCTLVTMRILDFFSRHFYTHFQLIQSETATGSLFCMVTNGWASHNWTKCSGGWSWEYSLCLLDTFNTATMFTCWLVEPGAHMPLPPLVEVLVRHHIISLTHVDLGFFLSEEKSMKRNENTYTDTFSTAAKTLSRNFRKNRQKIIEKHLNPLTNRLQ